MSGGEGEGRPGSLNSDRDDRAVELGAEAGQGFGGAEFAFEVAFEGLPSEAAEVVAATARPDFGGEGGGGGAQHALRELPGVGRERAGVAVAMDGAEESVSVGVEGDFAGEEGFSAGGAVGDVWQQAHEAGQPEGEVSQGHPGLDCFGLGGGGLVEHGEEKAECSFLGVVVGECFIQDLGKETQDSEAGLVYGGGEGRANDFELIKPDEFLAGPLGKPGAREGHGLEGSAEALAAFQS